MTNQLAIWLALVIAAVFVIDQFAFGGVLPVFLGKEMFEFLDWIAFWR